MPNGWSCPKKLSRSDSELHSTAELVRDTSHYTLPSDVDCEGALLKDRMTWESGGEVV